MFEPKIVCFLCKWCSYSGADLAGVSRMKYLPNGVIIRVMCSSRVDPQYVLKAFADGADGVLICGCRPGECHYLTGNYKTLSRVILLKRLLRDLGIPEERVRLEWVCASCAPEFVNAINSFTEEIRKLGPIELGRPEKEPALA